MMRLAAWLIPACWIASMGWVVSTDVVPGWRAQPPPLSAPSSLDTSEAWWGIYYQETRIGYARQSWRPWSVPSEPGQRGLSMTMVTELELPVQGTVRSINISLAVLMNTRHQVESLHASVTSGAQALAMTGLRQGEQLVIELRTAGQPAGMLTAPGDAQVSELLTAPWVMAEARPGMRWTRQVFDPLRQATVRADVEVLREEPPGAAEAAWTEAPVLVVRTTMGGLSSTSRVTRQGQVLQEETPLGFVMRREAPEAARLLHRRMTTGATRDLAAALAVPTDLRLADPRGTRALAVRLHGEEALAGLELASPRQQWAPEGAQRGALRVVQESTTIRAAQRLLPVQDAEVARWLAPEPLVQSDAPEIREQARAILGGERNAWQAAVRLTAWVHQAVQQTPAIGVPSAVEVLRMRQGDCNEHTALFAALARSAGIPTQICLGLVYHRDAFYYHAWPRVFVGEWVEVDPTLGQFVADATHIQLLTGDLSRQAELMPWIGRLRIEAAP